MRRYLNMNDRNPIDEERAEHRSSKGIIIAAVVCLAIIGIGIYLSINAYNDNIAENNARVISTYDSKAAAPSDIPKTTYEINPYNSQAYNEQAQAGKQLSQSYYVSSSASASVSASESAKEVMTTYTEPVSFMTPLAGEVLETFSDDVLVFSSTLGDWRTHTGVDFKGEVGDPVSAVADGTVLSFGYDEFYGNVLTISHADGYESVYCGLNDIIFFEEGDYVTQGEVVGTLSGDIPLEGAQECHLHLVITQDGNYMDPTQLIA